MNRISAVLAVVAGLIVVEGGSSSFAVLADPAPARPATSANRAQDPQAPIDTTLYTPPIVLACIGDSITARGNPNGYPSQLGRMLGDTWRVDNYGISGSTLMIVGGNAYQKKNLLPVALASGPQVVVIMLGTNDSKPYAWKKKSNSFPITKLSSGNSKPSTASPASF